MIDIAAIVAAAVNTGGIGKDGTLPWSIPGDMSFFKRVTSEGGNNAVIMGRKTWESIPLKFRPLPNRINVVVSRNDDLELPEDVLLANSLENALEKLRSSQTSNISKIFIIGGASIYKEALEKNLCNKILLTEVHNHPLDFECGEQSFDTHFPLLSVKSDWDSKLLEEGSWYSHGDLKYRFIEYTRPEESEEQEVANDVFPAAQAQVDINKEEMQYLNLCRHIIENGVTKSDRTGTGTIASFGHTMRFSLRDDTIPLLTTKRVFWRGVAEELLWFVRGQTDAKLLQQKNIHIWDGNASKEYMESIGLGHYAEGDLGPVYGFQWRNWGADYEGCDADYTDKGVDQLQECIDKIKNKPWDRRIIMSAWNVGDISKMALPPCHMFCQFFVDTEHNELHCQMYQRSADMGLGVPFNIASYSLLTHLIARVCGLKAGEFVHVLGDAHVYSNHVDALKVQLEREPRAFPKLYINGNKGRIEDFEMEDLDLVGYNPHKSIKMEMAV
eukprot:CAMPEP_0196812822 /NCGR_PEP_ID=MMETSP1362-20130617/31667_1 /TAXON_ID=163516 /ORGANISM="Leptocylindrus danicus, Strain CCMP1856" /LENGTH=498 /DNA_ID=CAMNT_0042188743 /DNA_START=63 /DNA_END=1559 /DNA_ORIENTATION=+